MLCDMPCSHKGCIKIAWVFLRPRFIQIVFYAHLTHLEHRCAKVERKIHDEIGLLSALTVRQEEYTMFNLSAVFETCGYLLAYDIGRRIK